MMGSSLGPTFANYYMANLEEETFKSNPELAPRVYARYVDDIFLVVNSNEEIQQIKKHFENNSVFKFT